MTRRFPKAFYHEHDTATILKRLRSHDKKSYLKDMVYGGIDGTVTTFAVVAGVVGAGLSSSTILILGVANLIADGFSMSVSNYMGTQTENQELDLLKEFEAHQIEKSPEGEINEVRNILKKKGFSGSLLDQNIEFYTANKKRWIDFMIHSEYGLSGHKGSPFKAAIVTFFAFFVFGSLPLLSYIADIQNPFLWSALLSGLSFALVGSLKSKWTAETAIFSAFKTLFIGSIASVLAYSAGRFVESLIH